MTNDTALKPIENDGDGVRTPVSHDDVNKRIFKACGGSEIHDFNAKLLNDVNACIRKTDDTAEERKSATMALLPAMMGFDVRNEVEGMIAAQAVALHNAAMECLRRAMIPEQPSEIASKLRKDGANLARAMTDMLEALDRRRGKRKQVVRVERVVVHEGAQAIVGNVTAGALSRQAEPVPLPSGAEAGVLEAVRTGRAGGGG